MTLLTKNCCSGVLGKTPLPKTARTCTVEDLRYFLFNKPGNKPEVAKTKNKRPPVFFFEEGAFTQAPVGGTATLCPGDAFIYQGTGGPLL